MYQFWNQFFFSSVKRFIQVAEFGMAFINVFDSFFLRFSRRRPIVLMAAELRVCIVFVMVTNVYLFQPKTRSHSISQNFVCQWVLCECVWSTRACVVACGRLLCPFASEDGSCKLKWKLFFYSDFFIIIFFFFDTLQCKLFKLKNFFYFSVWLLCCLNIKRSVRTTSILIYTRQPTHCKMCERDHTHTHTQIEW